jgi:hypothetical protein
VGRLALTPVMSVGWTTNDGDRAEEVLLNRITPCQARIPVRSTDPSFRSFDVRF